MKRKRSMKLFLMSAAILVAVLLGVVFAVPAQAGAPGTVHDFTTVTYDTVAKQLAHTEIINGATWAFLPVGTPTGSGTFHAFFRVGASPSELGYNGDFRPHQFDEDNTANFNRSVLLTKVPLVDVGGVLYREFQVDINESKATPYMSLDEFQVWVTNNQNLTGYIEGPAATVGDGSGYFPAGSAQLVYNLDGDGNHTLLLDYRVNTGSGKRDYKVLIPQADFEGKTGVYCTIFTRHGTATVPGYDVTTDDGFEEWGVAVYNTKSGYKFNDLNGNSVWDAGEPGLNGWTIKLDGQPSEQGSPPLSMSFTTRNDANGNPGYYIFPVPDGTYTVSEVQQAGWVQTYPASPGTWVVTLTNGMNDTDNNFGNCGQGCLEIRKVIDKGTMVGDLANLSTATFTVSITGKSYPAGEATDLDLQFKFEAGVLKVWNGTAWVAGDSYCVCNLLPGQYTAVEDAVAGWYDAVITGSPYTVNAGATCDTVMDITVTNKPIPGCLTITKDFDTKGVQNQEALAGTIFTLKVTGKTANESYYPDGIMRDFTLKWDDIGLKLYIDPASLTVGDLIPGWYVITEESMPTGWETVDFPQTVEVKAGAQCTPVSGKNTYEPACLTITKTFDLDEVVNPQALVGTVFTLKVTGKTGDQSYYPDGKTKDFTLKYDPVGQKFYLDPDNGVWTLDLLNPGDYIVSEKAVFGFTMPDPVTVTAENGKCVPASLDNKVCPAELAITKYFKQAVGWDPLVVGKFTFTLAGPGIAGTLTADADPADGSVDFGKLAAGTGYVLCELAVPAVWSTDWTMAGAPVATTLDANTGNTCLTNTFALTGCQILTFTVNNEPQGGCGRTPGYWKNWTCCGAKSEGNQCLKGSDQNDPQNLKWLLEEVLKARVEAGKTITIGGVNLTVDNCTRAIAILSNQDFCTGANMANDALYKLARNLLAARLNEGAGAYVCDDAAKAMADANALFAHLALPVNQGGHGMTFTGCGGYLGTKVNNGLKEHRAKATELAGILDEYNNARLCQCTGSEENGALAPIGAQAPTTGTGGMTIATLGGLMAVGGGVSLLRRRSK